MRRRCLFTIYCKGLSTKLAIRFEQIFTIKILWRENTKRETRGQPYLMQYTMLSHWSHLGKRGVPAGPKNLPLSKRTKWGKLWRINLIKTAKKGPDGTFKWIHGFSFIFLLYYTFHDLYGVYIYFTAQCFNHIFSITVAK